MAKRSKTAPKKERRKSTGIMKFLEAIVVLGTLAAVAMRFFKGKKKQ